MNKQSNAYTLIYAIVLVLVVGVVLSLIYQALRPMQVENIQDDTKRQILAAARIIPAKGESVSVVYDKHITDSYIVNEMGDKVEADVAPFNVDVAEQVLRPSQERLLPVFVCSTDEGTKYIVPVYGAGLWGPIWGFLAFDDNGDTIYGAYFAHQGETPGLGAEIEKPAFQTAFQGKDIFAADGQFQSVLVVKKGQEPKDGRAYVNAISGGTITSQGVQAMLQNSLAPYSQFFRSLKEGKEVSTKK